MQPRVSLVTLGVVDLERARRFYVDGLGFRASSASAEGVVFLQAGSVVLSLWGREDLAKDAGLDPSGSGFRGVALAWNVASETEVDQVLHAAKRAGAKLVKPAEKTFWGGYAGYFSDLDGHLWEIAHNPHWPLDTNGAIVLPP